MKEVGPSLFVFVGRVLYLTVSRLDSKRSDLPNVHLSVYTAAIWTILIPFKQDG